MSPYAKPRPVVSGLLLLGAVLLGAAALQHPYWDLSREKARSEPLAYSMGPGEALLHGVAPTDAPLSERMPLSTVVAALMANHAPAPLWTLWLGLASAAWLSLFALLCFRIGSTAGFAAGSVLLLFFGIMPAVADFHQAFYSILILLIAGCLVENARAPGPWKASAVALALGMSLFWRSTMVFFPPLLGAWEFSRDRASPWRCRLKRILPVLIIPYLFLIPWTHMNWTVHERFIPLEDWGTTGFNVVMGAAGLVEFEGGRGNILIEDPPEAGEFVTLWALRRMVKHPIDTARGFIARLTFIVSLKPWLVLLGLAGLWFGRRSGETQVLGLLAFYFTGIYGFLALKSGYFIPLWPLLAALAAAPAAGLLTGRNAKDPPLAEPAGAWVLSGWLTAGMVMSLFTMGKLSAFAMHAKQGTLDSRIRLDRLIAEYPRDSWLRAERAQRRLLSGEIEKALTDFDEALRHHPDFLGLRLERAWLKSRNNDAAELISYRIEASAVNALPRRIRHALYTAAYFARRGEDAKMRARLKEALRLESRRQRISITGAVGAAEKLRDRQHLSVAADIARSIVRLDELHKGGAFLSMLNRMAADNLDNPDVLLAYVRASAARGKSEHGFAASALARVLQAPGKPRLNPLEAASLFESLGETSRALAQLAPMTKKKQDTDFWIRHGRLAVRIGKKSTALGSFRTAQASAPTPAQRLIIALHFQEVQAYTESLSILTSLTADFPEDQDYLKGRGVAEFLSGKPQAAIATLRRAVSQAPESLDARLSLGTVYSDLGRHEEARRIYDAVLTGPASAENGLLKKIRSQRNALLR